jgi:dTDP-4-dehydrorhamnose 3,5-epimerase
MPAGFNFSTSPLPGLLVFQRSPVHDRRGVLDRLFDSAVIGAAGGDTEVKHVNLAVNRKKGTIRGLHYQESPHCETKIVTCLRGQVFDVVVDIRAGSPTFLESHVEVLGSDESKTVVIPPGFAHGYQTVEDDTELLYLHSAAFVVEAERGLHPLDATLGIRWPLSSPIISERDSQHRAIDVDWEGVQL